MFKPLALAIAGAALVAAVAGCGPTSHPKAHAAASSAAASLSALATNPVVLHDKAQAQKDLLECETATSIQLHPIKNFTAFVTCLQSHVPSKAAFLNCARQVATANGIGSGKLTADEQGLLGCMAPSSPSPSVSP